MTPAPGFSGLAVALVLGLLGALGKIAGREPFRALASGYVTFVRSVPDLCMMLLLYYGGQTLLNQLGAAMGLWDFSEIHPFAAGALTIGFIFGGYMTETFRDAFVSIPEGQVEAAVSLDLPPGLAFRKVILPQLLGYALPSLGVNWMVLLKTTALVSVLGLQDLVFYGVSAGRSTREPFLFLLAIMVIYLVLSDWVLRILERRYTQGRMLPR